MPETPQDPFETERDREIVTFRILGYGTLQLVEGTPPSNANWDKCVELVKACKVGTQVKIAFSPDGTPTVQGIACDAGAAHVVRKMDPLVLFGKLRRMLARITKDTEQD